MERMAETLSKFARLVLKKKVAITLGQSSVFSDALSIDLIMEIDGHREPWTIDLTTDGFHLVDLGVDLHLGKTPEEAVDSLDFVKKEGWKAFQLKKKR
jgi:hypothetical protein